MSQCFVLDTPPRGTEKKQYWQMAKKKGSTQDRVDHLRYRKRAISGITGEIAILRQLTDSLVQPHSAPSFGLLLSHMY
jgi:hypothetical protein